MSNKIIVTMKNEDTIIITYGINKITILSLYKKNRRRLHILYNTQSLNDVNDIGRFITKAKQEGLEVI